MRWRRITPIGVEVDADHLNAVQLRWSRGTWDVYTTASVRLPPQLEGPALAEVVSSVLRRSGFTGCDLHLLAGDREIATDSIERLPADDDGLRRLCAAALHVPYVELELAVWSAPSLGGRGFVAALPHSHAMARIRSFAGTGFEVVGLYPTMTALARLVRVFQQPLAVLRCGRAANTLTLVEAGQVIYHRVLDTPGGLRGEQRRDLLHLMEEVADTLACVPKSFAGLAVQRVLVSGELAEQREILPKLSVAGIQPEPIRDVAAAELSIGFPGRLPSRLDVALGLCLLEDAS